MAKYQVNLGVTANVSQAQQSIQNLQSSLNNIANTKITVDGGSIDTAAQSARLLSEHLAKATNATTGKIDFTALSNSLKAANTDLATLSNNLLAMGPKGQQAFSQIANAVAHAELSTRKANSALQSFGVTLMNTIKWQAASSMIHGVISTFNSAVTHIEKLDRSLNSIQIVSGKSAAEMASFAKQAQKAAEALSSTTTEYSDAALIYFQQGLNEKAIAERTEATLKMAKVTGTAVAEVSDQLTAIWNNFDDGTETLEHYVDVITALGAATASSTDEISDGLQKFAAIAETVGLSYEYAATALATVTAETRQSADVVGTAFKTLFARIQGLKLGETLDDGTTLNQYSTALAKVGIDIKMSNGELKSMNDILDEMGAKWERLHKDQQVALAQAVGGIRQYNQLIALMDNWDTFKINLEIAEDSKGELDKQFEIYQSSVEASAATLKQAKEALFENILSPDMISGFNEALADTINLFNTLIENAGGVGKLLEFGGLLLLQMVLPKLQGFLMSAATHMKDFIGYTKAAKMYELDTMAKTSHAIAGTSQRSNTRLSSSYEEGSSKFNRFERREDRRMARYDKWEARASTAQETLEQGPQKGLQHGINVIRANVADAKAQAYSNTGATFMPSAQGVAGVDMDTSAMTMRNQMIQEEAGYTATILDTKKQILALENGLTDKQREGYKAYSDQVAKEQEALRLAREKQAITKDTAEQSSRSGTMKVGSSKAGRDAKAAMKQGEIDQLEEERKKKVSSLTGDKESIARKTSEIDKEYNKKKEEVQNRHISNKQIDLKGDETKSMVEGFKDSDMSTTGQAVTQSMTDSLTQSADGSGPAASVENLEKLGQLQAQYNADAAKASGIYTELSGNIGEAGKRTEQQQKTLKKTGDTMKTLGKDAKSGLVSSLKESAKQMEKTGDSAEGLKKVIKSLEDGSDIDLGALNPKEMDAVKKSMGDLDEGLSDASTSAGELANAMAQDMASATGQDAKVFTGIAEDAQTAKASALDADNAAKQLQNTLNTQPPIVPDPFGTVLQGAQQATAAFTSFAMGAQMLSTGITTAFDENASSVERLMGVMMILQGVMSTINAIQTAANVVDTIAIAIKAAKAVATKKEADADTKDTVATGINTVATSANAVAKLFAAMASKGLAGIIAGVLGAALIAGTIAIVANTVATQQETEAKQEASAAAEAEAESHRENAEALKEETKEINKNADAYRKLYQSYLGSGEAKKDLRDATYELASSLDIENASLLILQGNYSRLNKEIEKQLKLKNRQAMDAAKKATKSSGVSFQTKVGASDGYWADDGDGDGQYTTGLWADTSNTDWITKFLNSKDGQKYKDAGINFTDGKLIADYDDEAELTAIWNAIDEMMNSDEFRQAAKNAKYDVSAGTLFKSYQRMKDETGDTYTNLLGAQSAEEEQARITGITESGLNDATNFNSFSSAYDNYINYLLKQAGETNKNSENAQRIIKDANDYLRSHDSYGELFQNYEAFMEVPDNVKTFSKSESFKKWLADQDISSKDGQELLTKVYFDETMTEQEIVTMLDNAQAHLNSSKLQAQVEFIPTAANKINDNMSTKDWSDWFTEWEKENGTSWFGENGKLQMTKEEFMALPADQAKAILAKHTPTADDQIAAYDEDIAAWQSEKEIIQNQGGYKATKYEQYYSEDEWNALITWGSMMNDIANGKELTEEERTEFFGKMQGYAKAATGKDYSREDIGGWIQGLEGKLPYDFGTGTNPDAFALSKMAADDYALYTQRQDEIDGLNTNINNAKKQKQRLNALDFKQSVIAEDLDYEELYAYKDMLTETIPYSEELYGSMEKYEDAVQDIAIANKKMERGTKTLASNWDDWNEIMSDGNASIEDIATIAPEMNKALQDILNLDAAEFELLPVDFAQKNWSLIQDVVNGVEGSVDTLRNKAGEEILLNVGVNVDGDGDGSLDAAFLELHNKIAGYDQSQFTVGVALDPSQQAEFFASCNEMINAAGMTAEKAQAYFASMGYDVELEEVEAPAKETPWHIENPILDEAATKTAGVPIFTGTETLTGTNKSGGGKALAVKTITPNGSYGGGVGVNTTAPKSSTGGGGGGNSKKTTKTKKSDVVERYKEVNDQIDDMEDKLRKANREAEGLWGAARLKKMRQIQSEMKKELKLMRQRRDEAKVYLEEDRQALQEAAKENGVAAFTFDANNNITNYDEIMNGLYAELKVAQDAAGPTTDENEQKKIDAIQERIDAIKDAISDFDNTREELEDFEDEIDEWVRSIQEAYLEELNLELEMKVMIDDSQLAKIEYYLGKVSEDIWSMAESAALMTGQGKDLFNFDLGQAEVWIGKFDDFKKRYDDLLYAYTHIDPETGETFINQEQFVKALAELQNDIYSNLDNINELDKTMISYYGDTLAAAGDELAKFTDLMDHHVGVLDHYASLLEIMGKSKDWDRIKTIQKTQVELAENSAAVSKANYEMLQAEADEKKKAWEALGKGLGDELTYEESVIKQQWLDAQNAANEAQNQMLEDAQAWAEALKALLETELEELGENLEKALAGDFGTLDYMMTSMERANSLQEEYLTTTNKVYETNKLMRTAQQEIDKTSNTVAKRRMAQFIEETQQMQNQNKLSQYELEIQQAKYDLLLAEIALEEAQSAKSTVRLQRDSEGNFGYVYTADQNEVANAQQQLEDAQNALYNIGLEGANKYAEQYAQTIQEMNDAVRELTEQWQNGEIASKEEYQTKMLELEEYYGEKLKQFSHLHSIAVQTDSRVANDAWTRDFAHMTTQTQYWMTQVSSYADQVGEAFGRYQQDIAEVEQYAGADLDSLKTKTEDIKKENEKLVTSITDPDKGLLHAMQLEIDKVDNITKKYQDWRKEIQGAIKDQENLAKIIGQEIENETDDDESNDRKPETETPEQTPPEGEPNENSDNDETPSYKKGILSWTGNGSARIWKDSAGKTYSATSAEGQAIQAAFNKAYHANGGYKGDYFLDWNRLNADVLHEKYGLSTGGYTGDWSGSFGKLAFLHQKELVLNKQDTENLLGAMEFLNRITSVIDLQAMNNSLGGLLSSPSLGHVGGESGILEQQVHIEASFPGVSDRNELEEAFNNLINQAAQYANRK